MASRFDTAVAIGMFLACSGATAQEAESGARPGIWQGNYQLDREDPRIRTRGGADLLRIQVIHSRGDAAITASWAAGRAICEDPTAEPCDWIGTNGTTRGRVIGDQIMVALPLSADEGDPLIVLIRRAGGQPLSGHIFNARGDFAWRISVRAIEEKSK